jgi:glutamine synthetase
MGQLALAAMTCSRALHRSYKRFGGSFAPTKAAWSRDNRTAGFRICGSGPAIRVECRIPGADANAYLVFAATLAAGLHGIEQKLDLEPEISGNLYAMADVRNVPVTLREALDALDKSKVLRKAFGNDVIDVPPPDVGRRNTTAA